MNAPLLLPDRAPVPTPPEAQVLRPYQAAALDALRANLRAKIRRQLLVSPTGCHARGQKILMFDGTQRAVEDVQVGDLLMGPDSLPRTVLELRRGVDRMHRISPTKGESFAVNEGHVLTLVRTNDGSKHEGEIVDVELREWLGWSTTLKHVHKLFRVGVDFSPSAPLVLNPYFLGVLLGDGALIGKVGVCKPDPEIRELLDCEARRFGLKVRTNGVGTSATHTLSAGRFGGAGRNPILNLLRDLGLAGTNCEDKFIPHCFKTAAREDRLALLAGLMDTDGSLGNNVYDFISKSERLADDVAFVARSLGFAAYVGPCEKQAQTGPTGTYHRVGISGDFAALPCRIPRKQADPRRQKKSVLRTSFTTQLLGEGEFFGFTLDSDGRYLLGDFTVTHNSGKTTIAAALIRSAVSKGGSVLFLAHRKELIDQCSARVDGFGLDHGIIQAAHWRYRPFLPVQIASVQTLVRRTAKPAATLVIVDEAHHATAGTYLKILESYPDAAVIGLSATPWRTDGRGLGELFQALVVAATPGELVAQGHLVPCTGFAYSNPDLVHVRRVAGDYDEHELGAVMGSPKIVGDILEQWMQHCSGASTASGPGSPARGLRTVAFAATIERSKELVEKFRARGVLAEHLDGETPRMEREAILARLASGATTLVSNVGVLAEGWDLPALGCVILASPTTSLGLFLQRAGRGLRPAPGKTILRIHDHTGGCIQFGSPLMDRDYSLERCSSAKSSAKIPPARTCKKCFAIYEPALGACPSCGHVNPKVERKYQDVEATEAIPLEQLHKPNEAAKRTAYEALLQLAVKRGHKLGWATHVYKARYKEQPLPSWLRDFEAKQATLRSDIRPAVLG